MTGKRLASSKVAIIVALIAAIATIIAALIAAGSFDNIFHFFTPSPTISISNDVKNISGQSIGINNAPFQVYVSGITSNTNGLNVYLIVNDGYHHYVQPGGGANVDKDFSILCQLGKIDDPDSFGKQYTIYAVVTNDTYADFAFFEGKSFIAKSEEIHITREALPTPTPTPKP